MNAIANDIRNLILERLTRASTDDLIRYASAYCANEQTIPAVNSRFAKLNAAGLPVSASSTDWVAVADSQTGLTWTRKVLDCGEVDHAAAMKAANAVHLFGADDWRAPTIQEQLSIVDYERFDPAIDTTYFDGPAGWVWTSTTAKSPSGCAWGVSLTDGSSYGVRQSARYCVRAVRASQT